MISGGEQSLTAVGRSENALSSRAIALTTTSQSASAIAVFVNKVGARYRSR